MLKFQKLWTFHLYWFYFLFGQKVPKLKFGQEKQKCKTEDFVNKIVKKNPKKNWRERKSL